MGIRRLTERLDRMPMLKLLAPFAAGIALSVWYTLPLWFLAAAFVTTGLVALLMRSSSATIGMLFVAGFAAAQLRTPAPSVPRGIVTAYEIALEGFPSDRGGYTTAAALITAWRDPSDGTWRASDARVRLYTDSLTKLHPGDRLRCRGTVRPFRGGAESYRRLMQRRGYAGTLWVDERAILERLVPAASDLHRRAVERLGRLEMGPEAAAVVESMAAGERRALSSELRVAYSRSGLAHLLAVSGLHTGIVFVLINALLWWLPLLRRGHLVKNLLAIGAVWLFVAAAGYPPSAVRAAIMCTVLQTALASGSEYVGMNALATAAFLMLLWNPNWLGDISFQLSFVAVAGILAWGVPLCRRCRTRWRPVNAVIDAYLIGLVASLATVPLIAHTFGSIPLAGLLINPLAILLGGVVVFAGTLWMLLPVGFLAPFFAFVAGHAAEGINFLARATAALPGGAVDYALSAPHTAVIYALYLFATLAAWSREAKKSVPLPT